MKPNYPMTRTVDQTDDYHGILVHDPYRWLEDVDSPETLEWIRQQNELTFSILEKIPARQTIKEHLTQLWDFSKAWAPHKNDILRVTNPRADIAAEAIHTNRPKSKRVPHGTYPVPGVASRPHLRHSNLVERRATCCYTNPRQSIESTH